MKEFGFPLSLLVLILIFSCSDRHSLLYPERHNALLTKTLLSKGLQEEFVIRERDINNYVAFRILEGKSKGKRVILSDITPIRWDSIPCLYVLQYENGFEIISADKRSPVPVAVNEHGEFDKCNDPEGFGGHLSLLASEIWMSLNGLLSPPSQEEQIIIQSSVDFWRMIDADSLFIAEHLTRGTQTQNKGRIPNGYWEMVEVSSEEEVYDSIAHLISTRWYQRGIYNHYCPEDRDTNNHIDKCPAGCVAIAGAQMLYFLHNKTGVPTTSPASGSCVGFVYDSSYVQNFWNYSSSTWSTMQPRYYNDTCAALLVGDIGKRVHMEYGWDGSHGHTQNLVDSVFSPYGWNCLYSDDYNSSIIVSSLSNGYPVVCAGSRLVRGVKHKGHAFLVDRYKRFRTKTLVTWRWVPLNNDPGGSPILLPPDDKYIYSSPHILYYGMNWGQVYTDPNNTWCSLSGVWQYDSLPPYIYNRRMIYNFSMQ